MNASVAGSRPAVTPVAAQPFAGKARRRLTLRFKSLMALGCFALYLVAVGAVVSWQRAELIRIIEGLERLLLVEATLSRTSTFSAHTVLRINESFLAVEPRTAVLSIELEIESIRAGLGALGDWYPKSRSMIASLEAGLVGARLSSSHNSILPLSGVMQELMADLDQLAREVRARRESAWASYRQAYDTVTLTVVGLFVFGLIVFGGIMILFFSRLARDLRTLAARAVDVVRGDRGSPLEVTRSDEVGALMDAINRMQHILREREQQIEVARQQRFHHEKMAAIGSLAAAVAHEINNPIAAIEAIAETIHSSCQPGACAPGAPCLPELILEHTRRIVGITRQLSEMSSPLSAEPEWIDLNGLVRRTTTFVSYDPRFRAIRMEFTLDPATPAVWAVADHVTQTLMNLLINAADALQAVHDRERRVWLSTQVDDGFVRFDLHDNGPGMEAQVLARVFEESFTTKPSGRGVGLFMCKTLVEGGGGRIALASVPGVGSTVTLMLPSHPVAEVAASF